MDTNFLVSALSISGLKIFATLLILAGAIYGFVSEKVAPDVVALLAMLALLLTGVLRPDEAFSGFSHPATVSVAAVLVLSSAIERTGVLSVVARRVLAPLGGSEFLLTAVIMVVIGVLSAFVNNTAAVAIFIPVVLEVCRQTGASPGRVLMPMSHAATFGGMCTLVGTSTNLVAHEFARNQGLPGFSMFELGKVGLPMVLVGFAYILFVGRWFLPRTQAASTDTIGQADPYLSELIVMSNSPWIGREVNPEKFRLDLDVELVGLVRDGRVVGLEEQPPHFAAGDSLRVRGALDKVLALAASDGLEVHRPEDRKSQDAVTQSDSASDAETPNSESAAAEKSVESESVGGKSASALRLAEVVVLTTSGLIGRTLKQIRFAERFDSVVLALRRRGGIRERPSTTPLHAGDVLLVEGSPESLTALAETRGFLVVGTIAQVKQRPHLLLITTLVLMGVVGIAALGILPIVTAAVAGCAVLMLTGCLPPRDAYQAIDLSLVFLLAGTLALGTALEKTGITTMLANGLAAMTGVTGPYVVLACFFLVAVGISELMSNSGTVALLAPVAVSSAAQMGINPMALLAAIAFGASASFAMPMGYQTSLMIYGPGGYRFKDFVRMGIALDVLLALLALWLIPQFWPLTAK
ncbi:MAG: SLC13 family permease [Acidobacteria bacterium]|nr:SLC13 family permease [Acidobacteriota bacterium]